MLPMMLQKLELEIEQVKVDDFTSGGPKGILARGFKDMLSEISVLLTMMCTDCLQTGLIADNGKSQA